MKLPSSTIWNPFTTGSPVESSISCSFWTKVQWECVHCSSRVQVHFHPFKPLQILVAQTSKPPSENDLAEVSYVCSQPSCRPTELQSSFYSSNLRNQLSMFCPCASLWHLGSHFWFLWFFLWMSPCFLYSCLCLRMKAHSWTMTCSVCLCHTISCLCFCVHCSLVENVLHST